MSKSKLVEANKKIEEGVVNGYKKIEEGVVGGYKKSRRAPSAGSTKSPTNSWTVFSQKTAKP